MAKTRSIPDSSRLVFSSLEKFRESSTQFSRISPSCLVWLIRRHFFSGVRAVDVSRQGALALYWRSDQDGREFRVRVLRFRQMRAMLPSDMEYSIHMLVCSPAKRSRKPLTHVRSPSVRSSTSGQRSPDERPHRLSYYNLWR